MTTIRRVYVYVLAFAGLAVLATAVANLGQVLIDNSLASNALTTERLLRQSVAQWGAAALVALPTWLAHWLWAERRVRTDDSERASVLRRLYLYAVLTGAALIAIGSVRDALVVTLGLLLGERTPFNSLDAAIRPLPFALAAILVWLGHWRIVVRDRLRVGEVGGSATLRRWYVYGLALISFVLLIDGSRELLEQVWRGLIEPGHGFPFPIATVVVGLSAWLVHGLLLARQPDDRAATLRGVYLFLGLAITVFGSLLGLSQLLYYVVARLLGVARPNGIGDDLILAAAGPASLAVAYGAAWLHQRSTITTGLDGRDVLGVRRLYAYLVALLSLLVLSIGVGGVLWTLVDVSSSSAWRDQLALYATAVIVALPMWLVHWAPRARLLDESGSVARRLYVYLTLIFSMLALFASTAKAIYHVLELALGGSPEFVDIGHALAVAAVAASVAIYHWRGPTLRQLRVQPAH